MFQRISYALIKAVREDAVLLECDGKEYEIELLADTKQPIFDAVEEGIFLVPFDKEKEQLLLSLSTDTIKKIFPEHELEELQDATKELPDEYK